MQEVLLLDLQSHEYYIHDSIKFDYLVTLHNLCTQLNSLNSYYVID